MGALASCSAPRDADVVLDDGVLLEEGAPPSDADGEHVAKPGEEPSTAAARDRPWYRLIVTPAALVALVVALVLTAVALARTLSHAGAVSPAACAPRADDSRACAEPHPLAHAFFDVECMRAIEPVGGAACAIDEANAFLELVADQAQPLAQLTVAPATVLFLVAAHWGSVPVPSGALGVAGYVAWVSLTVVQWVLALGTLATTLRALLAPHQHYLCCATPWLAARPAGPRLLDVVTLTTVGLQPAVLAALAVALMHPLALRGGLRAYRHASLPPLAQRALRFAERALIGGVAAVQAWLSALAVALALLWTVPTGGALVALLAFAPLALLSLGFARYLVVPLVQRLHALAGARAGRDDAPAQHADGGKAHARRGARTSAQAVAASARDALRWIEPMKVQAERRRVLEQWREPIYAVTVFFFASLALQGIAAAGVLGAWAALSAEGSSAQHFLPTLLAQVVAQYRLVWHDLRLLKLASPWQPGFGALARLVQQPSLLLAPPSAQSIRALLEARAASLSLALLLAALKLGLVRAVALLGGALGGAYAERPLSELTRSAEASARIRLQDVLGTDVVYLRDVGGGDEEAYAISAYLRLERTQLQLLVLSRCELSAQAVRALLGAAGARRVQQLELSSCALGVHGAEALAEQLRTTPSIERLILGENRLGARGAAALAGALSSEAMAGVNFLTLRENGVGDDGAIALAGALKAQPMAALLVLSLELNGIGDAGAIALADALSAPSGAQLTVLNLRGNRIGDRGALALARVLKVPAMPSLRTLWLHGNRIGDAGVAAIADALPQLDSLYTLALDEQRPSAGREPCTKSTRLKVRRKFKGSKLWV